MGKSEDHLGFILFGGLGFSGVSGQQDVDGAQ